MATAKKAPSVVSKKASARAVARGSAGEQRVERRKAVPKAARAQNPARPARRADFGAAVDAFFEKQPPTLKPILDALRTLVAEAAPSATSSIKWGMPSYELDGVMMCALGAHKSHVNLILSGPAGSFPDPQGRLSGEGKTGRHLKLTSLAQLPRKEVKSWLKRAAQIARGKAG